MILHGILAMIAWDFSPLVNYHLSDRTNNGDNENRDWDGLL